MPTVVVETKIAAPPERCFLLSLSIDLHMASTARTHEQAVAGVTHGLIGLGESVTWKGRHFGFLLTHETLITKYDRPRYFQDVMVKGCFRRFEHDHHFDRLADGTTLVRDELRFAAPLGPFGWLVEKLVLRRYLSGFLAERNLVIKRVAEAEREVWQPYLTSSALCDHPDDVAEVRALGDFRLHARFFDGTEGTVDMSALVLAPDAGVFAGLADPSRFAEAYVEMGAVAWPGGLDPAPDAMYAALRDHGVWRPK